MRTESTRYENIRLCYDDRSVYWFYHHNKRNIKNW